MISVLLIAFSGAYADTHAQGTWTTDTQQSPASPPPGSDTVPGVAPFGGMTTVVPRGLQDDALAKADPRSALVTLEAFLTSDNDLANRRAIDRGLVWRVFALGGEGQGTKLVATRRDPTPTIKLPSGKYAINAAFGRAYLTHIVEVRGGERKREPFILNAGGLRVIVDVAGGGRVPKGKARYDIYSDERDQSGARRRILTNVRPGLITRLNSGIYHIVSRLGDANALVSAEVAVESGKLTEAVVSHEAAKVTFKLVQTAAGEAIADTQWIIMTRAGDIVMETAGAVPTHLLAPGEYSVSARWGGKLFTRTFDVKSGDTVEVEVMMN